MEENNGKKGRYQRKEIANSPLKGNKSAIDIAKEIEFLKLREGETHEEWETRTQKLRILPEKEHEKRVHVYKTRSDAKSITAKYVIRKEKDKEYMASLSKQKQYQYRAFLQNASRKGLVVYQGNRDPLLHYKYMFVIMRMFEVKYKLKQTEILFLIHFYSIDRPFLKKEFDEKAFVSKGVSFNKYVKLGLIQRLRYSDSRRNYRKLGFSPFYSLSMKCVKMIKTFFSYTMGNSYMDSQKWYFCADDKEEMKFLVDMYYDLRQEIKGIEQGTISDDRFYPIGINIDALENPLGDGNIL